VARAITFASAPATTSTGVALARVFATGVDQHATHTNGAVANKISDLKVTNGGSIQALATATGNATYAGLRGEAVGVWQSALGADTSSALVANTGSIIATATLNSNAHAKVFSSYDAAFSTYVQAIGVNQNV